MITVGVRTSLWEEDQTSSLANDSWAALDSVGETSFRQHFEQNTAGQVPTILEIKKVEVGGQKALFVDYELVAREKAKAFRLRTHFVLREHRWWGITSGSSIDTPDAHLDEMMRAARTFKLE